MTVQELKEAIKDLPDDMNIILQKDSEGNGYSPLAGADPDGLYFEESSYAGEVYDAKWTAKEAAMDELEWERMRTIMPRSLILHPVN